MNKFTAIFLPLAFLIVVSQGPVATLASDTAKWKSLAPGMELGTLMASKPSSVGDSRITVVRIDPQLWDLEFMGISLTGEGSGLTAREWCKNHDFSACINAGMFAADYKAHIGYLQFRDHINSSRVNNYQSVAAFDPKDGALPRFHIFDLDATDVTMQAILKDYASAIQNLRLIKRPGLNRWGQHHKMWSEAALGEDNAGRILFVFCRSPFSMHDLNHELLTSNIEIVAAQHLEGGPEAQLYLHVDEVELEVFGSYETSFREDNENATPWAIPNVLGVRERSSAAE